MATIIANEGGEEGGQQASSCARFAPCPTPCPGLHSAASRGAPQTDPAGRLTPGLPLLPVLQLSSRRSARQHNSPCSTVQPPGTPACTSCPGHPSQLAMSSRTHAPPARPALATLLITHVLKDPCPACTSRPGTLLNYPCPQGPMPRPPTCFRASSLGSLPPSTQAWSPTGAMATQAVRSPMCSEMYGSA